MTSPDVAPLDHSSAGKPPRPAATLVVVRDAPGGLQVLLLCRAERGDHNSGAWVFPGGTVDKTEHLWRGLCDGSDDAAMSARLGVPEGGLDYAITAIRECFEECGLLFARRGGALVSGDDAARLAPWRDPLNRGERTLGELHAAEGLTLAVDELAYFSHWLTPLGRAKRYDTRFFVAVAPAGQTAQHDGQEMVGMHWLRPAEALARSDSLKLMGPTRATLSAIAGYETAAALMAYARGPRTVSVINPRIGAGSQGLRPVMPHEYAWAEMGRIDPLGHGTASYEIVPGRAVRLSPHVIRVTAANPSVMTGPGTNTYLVGCGAANEWAVIDPGPDLPEHVEAVLHAAPGPVRWILATHTHHDHSPAAVALQQHTHAPVMGRVAVHPHKQDGSFVPDRVLEHGERLPIAPGVTLRVLHTPGHASNHLCYLLEEEKTLFTGDHLMQASTVVINPPDGDMAAYLRTLRALLDEDIDWLAPGHGFLMAQPHKAVQAVIDHRLKREAKVLDTLKAHAPATLEQLLPHAYDDVDPRMLPVAARSLLAHLDKLRTDGVATDREGHWSLT
ncbi:MBL fold metallo-hydrolase [Piscinibacter sp. HJYY11]|uniref:MBL fold metallo-hydrolase n=1 Tax=Piscinibacter sp. HJYY11 TaxID=2801333 RepID=UPI00191E2F14|nr:MBL fold metallo-hydrolase [Piscinibacter sp. HJYY11]MBL0728398.1 MBL fold metallo-hydrolase [Piscinibacter sp. HJYY11]